MFSNYRSVELKFNYFKIIFDYYWFIELQLNRYKLLLFIRFIIYKLLLFGVLVIIFTSLIVDLFVCIYQISVHWYWNLSLSVIKHFSVGHIQPGYTYFLPPQVCGRSWQGLRLGVQTFLIQLIDLIDLRSPSSYLFKTSLVDGWLVCIIFTVSVLTDTETFPRVC